METIRHIHHISAIVGDAQENLDFYRDILQLRLVKKTLNFDDPSVYHLYFANQEADSGTLITFFPWENHTPGQIGSGQGGRILFSIPSGTLPFWQERLTKFQVPFVTKDLFGASALFFQDRHQLELALVESTDQSQTSNILGFHGVFLHTHDFEGSYHFMKKVLGLVDTFENDDYYLLETIGPQKHIIYLPKHNETRGHMGPGTVHHIAWNVSDLESLKSWYDYLNQTNFNVTTIRNRKYFKSIYFREPGKVIFELATQGPGLTIDETKEELGKTLLIPPIYEKRREELIKHLKPLH